MHSEELNNWDLLTTLNHLKNFSPVYFEEDELDDDDEQDIVKFVACGKDEPFDPDMSYPLTFSTKGTTEGKEELKDSTDQ